MKRFKNILCVVGPGPDGRGAVARALTLADNNQAQLTVVEVIDEIPPNTTLMERTLSPVDLQGKLVVEHQKGLQELVASLKSNIEIQTRILTGEPFWEIIRDVLRYRFDLVIKMSESVGLIDRVFGSDDMHLLRKCPCPVWLVTSESPNAYKRILATVDINDDYSTNELDTRRLLNEQVLEMASSLALSEFAELHIVYVWKVMLESTMRGAFIHRPEEEVVAYIEDERQRHQKNLNVLVDETIGNLEQSTLEHISPQIHLLKGSPRSEIPVFAGEIKADIVVMGTVARTGLPGVFMGNTAETILNQLNCSVLAIKPPGFKTPVTLED
ncbi:MAG: universal stress protein [Gammaproteobacteria bacterium]